MFLSDSHSDGTHSHPLRRHIYNNRMKTQTHLDLKWSDGEHVSASVHLQLNYSLILKKKKIRVGFLCVLT